MPIITQIPRYAWSFCLDVGIHFLIWGEAAGGWTAACQLVSLTIRSRRSLVKKQLKISKGVFDTSNLTLTPGLPWKLKRLGILSFHCQTNLLAPGAFLCTSLDAILESGLSMSSVVSACETQSSLSSKLDISKHGSTVSSALLATAHHHSHQRKSCRRWETVRKTKISAVDGTKAPWQEVPMKSMVHHLPLRRRKSVFECWQSEALQKWVMSEVHAPLYKGKFPCFELTGNMELTIASKVKETWVTCYIAWPITP